MGSGKAATMRTCVNCAEAGLCHLLTLVAGWKVHRTKGQMWIGEKCWPVFCQSAFLNDEWHGLMPPPTSVPSLVPSDLFEVDGSFRLPHSGCIVASPSFSKFLYPLSKLLILTLDHMFLSRQSTSIGVH